MKQWRVLGTIFPSFITENFEFVDYKECDNRLDYWLYERGYMSREDSKKGAVRGYGFTEERVIQGFPIRGKAVFLHVRRRKWRDTGDGSIITYDYDMTEDGSRLPPEFVAFLKEEDWIHPREHPFDSGGQFRTVSETFRNHYDTILNCFLNRSTNAGAESFNAKFKVFRSQFRGVTDIPFFLFRLSKLCA